MGWGRIFLLGDVGQQLDIGDVRNAVAEMQQEFLQNQRADLDQAKDIAALRRENQELKMYLAAIVRLLVSKGVLQNEEVAAIVRAIEPEH